MGREDIASNRGLTKKGIVQKLEGDLGLRSYSSGTFGYPSKGSSSPGAGRASGVTGNRRSWP